jgi:hypothetical protein
MDEVKRVIAALPSGFLDLGDLDVTSEGDGTVTATAVTTVGGARADVLLTLNRAPGSRGYLIGIRPDDWSLGKALPDLALPALDGLTLSNVVLVVAADSVNRSSDEMEEGEYDFYQGILGEESFTLRLRPGINLLAAIPVDRMPEGHPLLGIMDALGIERGVVRLQGTLGRSLTMLATPGGGAAALRDLFLRAELPPMRPPGSPEWFRSGQLALEVTGDPSIRLVGEMNVRIQDDELAFFLAAALAKAGVSLSGGLKSEEGWDQPFGIQWMTLRKVVLKIGITPAGSVQLGFGGDLVVGKKDMAVAVALAISPTGVPTNFIFAGESEAGFGISDLAELQQKMAAARDAAAAAAGTAGPLAGDASIPIDALPQVEFRDVALKFAPKDEPDLGVQRGMAIKGRLLLPGGSDGSLTDVAAVDVNVGEDGLWVRGKLAAYRLGPLTWEDALLDLTATREEQRLRLAGDVQLLGSRQKVDLDMSRTQLRFSTRTELYGLFRARLDALAAFDLRQPKFRVKGVAESDLGELLSPVIRDGAVAFVAASGPVLEQADAAIAGIREALGRADATAAELRAAIERQRDAARAGIENARRGLREAGADVAAARAERDRARALWDATPVREVALKASRRAAWLRLVARYNVAAGRYASQAAVLGGAERVLAALPPVDQNVAVAAATAAAATIRAQLAQAEQNLEGLRKRIEAVSAALRQGGTLIAIDRAELEADLEALSAGRAVEWRLAGNFTNTPFDIRESLDFSDLASVGGKVLTRLIHQ